MELLKKLTECASPSGREDLVRDIIKEALSPFADEIYTDNLGSLICHKKGSGKRIMLASHMDEIGFAVTFIDEKGFIRFAPVGGQAKVNCINRKVRFTNGVTGTISYENREDPTKIGFDKMFIDIGAKNKEEAENLVKIGDMAVFSGECTFACDKIISKALDDRAGCYALICAFREIKNSPNDIYAVFTAQEEVGLRGARTAANKINPDVAVALDVSGAGDTPYSNEYNLTLGEGPAIKCMDKSFIIHPIMRKLLTDCAREISIPYQMEAAGYGGTDAGAIHLTGAGVPSATISIPTRYIHSPGEVVSKDDLKNTSLLIKKIMETDINKYLD